MCVEQLLLHVWSTAKPKRHWCDLMRKWINRLLRAALFFPQRWGGLTLHEENETSISGGPQKYQNLPKSHLWLVFKPCFIALGVVINCTSLSVSFFFVSFVYAVLALRLESSYGADAAVHGHNQPVELQCCRLWWDQEDLKKQPRSEPSHSILCPLLGSFSLHLLSAAQAVGMGEGRILLLVRYSHWGELKAFWGSFTQTEPLTSLFFPNER